MTHDTDCRVLDEWRDEVDEIAEMYDDGRNQEAFDRATDLGWERIGKGASRVVWRVATDQQEGPVEDATHEAPCVVKFDFSINLSQNTSERRAFEQFPEEMRDPGDGVPPIVPVADHHPEDLWLSMPEANAGTVEPSEVIKRLAEHGWACGDLAPDNVGDLHGEPVVLDYALDCHEAPGGETGVDIIEAELRDAGANVRTTYDTPEGDWVAQFNPNPDLNPGRHDVTADNSLIRLDAAGDVKSAVFVFGGYMVTASDPERPEELAIVQHHGEQVAQEIADSWMGLRADVRHISSKFGATMLHSVAFIMDFTTIRAPMTPATMASLWDDFAGEVKVAFPGSLEEAVDVDVDEDRHRELRRELEGELEKSLEGI